MTYRKRWSSLVQTSTTIPFILLPFDTCDWVRSGRNIPCLGVRVEIGRAALARDAQVRIDVLEGDPARDAGALDDRQVDAERGDADAGDRPVGRDRGGRRWRPDPIGGSVMSGLGVGGTTAWAVGPGCLDRLGGDRVRVRQEPKAEEGHAECGEDGRNDSRADPVREGAHGIGIVSAVPRKRRRPLVLVPSGDAGPSVDRRRARRGGRRRRRCCWPGSSSWPRTSRCRATPTPVPALASADSDLDSIERPRRPSPARLPRRPRALPPGRTSRSPASRRSCRGSTSRLDAGRHRDAGARGSRRDRAIGRATRPPADRRRLRRHAGRGIARSGRDDDRPARPPRPAPTGRRRRGASGSPVGRGPDRPDGRRRRRPDPGRRDRLSRRSRAPVGDLPARRRAGQHRDDVPCRPRGIARPRPRPRRARAGGAGPACRGCSSSARGRLWRSTSGRPRTVSRHAPRSRRPSRPSTASCRPTTWPTIAAGWSSTSGRGRRAASARRSRSCWRAIRPATVVAFGDDVSDADGFAVLRAARDAGVVDGLAVGVVGPHGMPDEVRAAADVVLASPFLAARALAAIATALERERRPPRSSRSCAERPRRSRPWRRRSR